ncbi:D-alanyl-D-alanine carboxypeptidase family protein [Sutcliffiella halmapala]|uniref:D-alanyl-D-alanine carboxypeptidase family protein n=1 Tax=Sutcliffiella halmapala TaxID=79882 RepID=UPI000994E70B|nr:D-alanyl-D-alanine carboxypeptidase family protein [Sutcliffiella halmapala]
MKKNWLAYLLIIPILLTVGFPIQKAQANEQMELFSESALLIDAKSGDILYEKDSEKIMYPASITKIVTAIIAIEEGNLDDIVTVSEKARYQEGSKVYLLEGEEVPLLRLVQGLMINSGNDAGTAIAEHMNGSEEAFALRMTKFVKERLGAKSTNFTNPHGLFEPKHVTTAQDMAKIAQYAMGNETFREIVGTKEMEWIGEGWETTLFNHHRLLWDYEGTTGVKNGYVPESGHTLVTSAERDGKELIVVTLKAASKYYTYLDTMTLLDYGFQNFENFEVAKGQMVKDAAGTDYMIAKNILVSKQADEEIKYTVNEDRQLVVTVGDRENIKEDVVEEQRKNDISPLASTVAGDKNTAANQTTEQKSSLLPVILVFGGLLFLAYLVSRNRRRRRRKRHRERMSDSIILPRRSK